MTRVGRRAIEGTAAVVAAAIAVACSDNPGPDSTAYKQGTLGNGGFLFQCDDSVACDRWSTSDAKDFPTKIATGSNFELRFVANQDKGGISSTYPGSTLRPLAPYVSTGPDGFTTLKPGFGTVLVQDARGAVIDYVTLNIVRPDSLVVYTAEFKGDNPTPIESIAFQPSDRKSFRTVGQKDQSAIAGSIHIEWTSADPTIVAIESYDKGVVNVVAKAAGSTTVSAAGAALTKTIAVTVSAPAAPVPTQVSP